MADPRLEAAATRVASVRQDCRCGVHLTALADSLAEVIDYLRDEAVAPVVTIARGPLDFQPAPEITLATVVPDDADREWWRSRVVPLAPEEEGR